MRFTGSRCDIVDVGVDAGVVGAAFTSKEDKEGGTIDDDTAAAAAAAAEATEAGGRNGLVPLLIDP